MSDTQRKQTFNQRQNSTRTCTQLHIIYISLILPRLYYLHIDNFFSSKGKFCKIWLQSQFVVLWQHACGKSLKRFLYTAHCRCDNAEACNGRHKNCYPSSKEAGRPKKKPGKNCDRNLLGREVKTVIVLTSRNCSPQCLSDSVTHFKIM